MKRALKKLSVLLFLPFIFTFSCQRNEKAEELAQWMSDSGKLKVLCTTAMVGDLVKQVGGDDVDCFILIQGESDPHSYQLVKGDDEKFLRADLIFYNGLGLEHGPSLAHNLAGNPKAHALGDYLLKEEPASLLVVDGVRDPHVWMDVSLFSKTIPFIADMLAQKEPAKKSAFFEREKAVRQHLMDVHDSLVRLLHELPSEKRYLVSTHDAFNYFARAYLADDNEKKEGFWRRCQAPEGLAPDSQLSTQDITRLLDHLIRYNIHCLFAESNVSQDSIRKLLDASQKKGHAVRIASSPLYGDAMGRSGSDGDSYEKMMQHNATTIKKELEQ